MQAQQHQNFDARLPGGRRLLLLIYWGGAAFLAPWIVALYLTQSVSGLAYHLRLVSLGISALMVAGMVTTGWAVRRGSHLTVVAAAFTGTLVFITAWFLTVTAPSSLMPLALSYALVVQLPVVVLCAWTLRRLYRRGTSGTSLPSWVGPVLVAGGLVLIPLVVAMSSATVPVRAAYHLRLVWTGLDVFELIGLVTTGWCLRHRSLALPVAAAFTGTLLFCDAWFNVVATTGTTQLAGIAMAFVELPLSALSFVVAHRQVAAWRGATPDPAPEPA